MKYTEQGFVHLDVKSVKKKAVDGIEFSVSDSGIGISEEDAARIFQRFSQISSRISSRVEGTGLGLSLVKSLTELHDGLVSLDSKVAIQVRSVTQVLAICDCAGKFPCKNQDLDQSIKSR